METRAVPLRLGRRGRPHVAVGPCPDHRSWSSTSRPVPRNTPRASRWTCSPTSSATRAGLGGVVLDPSGIEVHTHRGGTDGSHGVSRWNSIRTTPTSIVARFEKFFGRKAERLDAGEGR